MARHAKVLGVLGPPVTTTWLYGFVDELELASSDSIPAGALWRTISSHRSYRFMRSLSITNERFLFDGAVPPPDAIRTLRLRYNEATLRSLDRVAMPWVTRIEIDLGEVTAIDHSLVAGARSRFPALASFVIARNPPRRNRAPQHAPAGFQHMPRVRLVLDQSGWVYEWAGSGVPIEEHPIGVDLGRQCSACHGQNTAIIWARSEHEFTHGGWSERMANRYELVCRSCGGFTTYHD